MITFDKKHIVAGVFLLIMTDGYNISVKSYTDRLSAHNAMVDDYNNLNNNTDDADDEWAYLSHIGEDDAILYAAGENVYVWKIVEIKAAY